MSLINHINTREHKDYYLQKNLVWLYFKGMAIIADKKEHTKEEIIGKPPFGEHEVETKKEDQWKEDANKRGLKTGN